MTVTRNTYIPLPFTHHFLCLEIHFSYFEIDLISVILVLKYTFSGSLHHRFLHPHVQQVKPTAMVNHDKGYHQQDVLQESSRSM